jgi:hypothetical protein
MAYSATPTYGIRYPNPDEEMNIPEDMQILAESSETAMLTLVNNNLIKSATARLNSPPEAPEYCAAVVSGGVLNLVFPRTVNDPNKLSTSGGTITGDLTVTGKITTTAPTSPNHVATKSYVDSAVMPIGAIISWAGTSATLPNGWALCDGSVHGSAALLATTGSATTPDLRDKFVIGKSATKPHGVPGGSSLVTLTTRELPIHGHTTTQDTFRHSHVDSPTAPQTTGVMTRNQTHTHPLPTLNTVNLNHDHPVTVGNASANHTHHISFNTVSGGAHSHITRLQLGNELSGSAINYLTEGVTNSTAIGPDGAHIHAIVGDTGGQSATHTHAVDVLPLYSTSTGAAALTAHTHTVTAGIGTNSPVDHEHKFSTNEHTYSHTHGVNNTGQGLGFPILPPYLAFAYIIYKGI